MTISHGIKSIFRTPFKTILFIVLVAAVTAFACLGFGMLGSSDKLIEDADEMYSTVAAIEYIDDGYPDTLSYSETMYEDLSGYDFSALSDNSNVLVFDRQYEIGGYIDGLSYMTRNKPFDEYGVVKFKCMHITDKGISCVVMEPYFSGGRNYRSGTIFKLEMDPQYSEDKIELIQPGKTYIAHGKCLLASNRTEIFQVSPYVNSKADDPTYDYLFSFPIWDITDSENYEEHSKFDIFQNMTKAYKVMNNYISVHPTLDVSTVTPFLQQETYLLDDGVSRFFTADEYTKGAKAVIISGYVAGRLGVEVGDTINLGLYYSTNESSSRYSFWSDNDFVERDDYKIVGIFADKTNLNMTVYIPKPIGEETWLPNETVCYHIASVLLKNGSADAYYQAVLPKLLPEMSMSIFDGGYAQAVAPILAMRETAILLVFVSMVCCTVVLFLFAYMYISKQRSTAHTMIALGTGKLRTSVYLITCVVVVAVIAAAVGGVCGYHLSQFVTEEAYEYSQNTTVVDHRFSAFYADREIKQFDAGISTDKLTILYVAAAVVTVSLVFAILLSVSVLKKDRINSGAKRPSFIRRLWFSASVAIKSTIRGGLRNAVVPVASLVLLIFIGIFSMQILKSEEQIDMLYDNSEVYTYYTTVDGKKIDILSLDDADIDKVIESGFVEKAYYSSIKPVDIVGVIGEGGAEMLPNEGRIVYPTGGFAFETFVDTIRNKSKCVYTTDISRSPEFMFESDIVIEYLDGYDSSIFESDEYVCALSTSQMKEKGIKLGDKIRLGVYSSTASDFMITYHDVLVVAEFAQVSGKDNIYMPINHASFKYYVVRMGRSSWVTSEYPGDGFSESNYASFEEVVERYPYNAVNMKLRNLREIAEFKDYLEENGYSSVNRMGRARKWIVVADTSLNSSVTSINRHISYMTILFYAVYVISVMIGFVISNLLTKSRKRELAMMRSMGAGMIRTFLVFFMEQAVLCLIGCALGVGLLAAVFGEVLTEQWYCFMGYAGCYWSGIIISIAFMNRINVISILTEKD